MANKSFLALAAGMAGAVLFGYCLYFDRKRRNDPDYKKKVHERRQMENGLTIWIQNRNNADVEQQSVELNDHEVVQQYFQAQIKLSEELFRQDKLEQGLAHFSNALMLCAQPVTLMEAMKIALPEHIFDMLMNKLPELQNQSMLAETISVELDLD